MMQQRWKEWDSCIAPCEAVLASSCRELEVALENRDNYATGNVKLKMLPCSLPLLVAQIWPP
jgi:hypothetical protein